jgi:hypothetical protein
MTRKASSEPARREEGIGACWDLLPHVEPILAALLRGLNSPDYDAREQAIKGLLLAFPNAGIQLSRVLMDIESDEPKVRLAAIREAITILANALAALAGMKSAESAPTGGKPDRFTEDLMEHAGRWIAWTQDRKRILAVANSFVDVMAQAEAAGESDPYVKKAPGIAPRTARKAFALLEDESPDIIDDVRKVFPDAEAWLNAPNDALGGAKPRNLIGTDREPEVRYLLRGIEDGITT